MHTNLNRVCLSAALLLVGTALLPSASAVCVPVYASIVDADVCVDPASAHAHATASSAPVQGHAGADLYLGGGSAYYKVHAGANSPLIYPGVGIVLAGSLPP